MRLFALAKGLSPIGADQEPAQLPEKLKINRQLVIPRNPWQTYLNLRKAIALEQWKRSAGDLPRVGIRALICQKHQSRIRPSMKGTMRAKCSICSMRCRLR